MRRTGRPSAGAPYVVREYHYEARELQPIATQRHGVYHPFEREHVAYNYERNPADPRITHHLSLEVDPLGHVLREAQLAYARRAPAQPEQGSVLATCRTTTYRAADRRDSTTTGTAWRPRLSSTSSSLPRQQRRCRWRRSIRP